MVDRQVKFLDLVGLLFRNDNSDICELRELSACLSCETDNFKSIAFAVTAAYITFSEFPEVLIPRNTSPAFP